MHFYTNVQQEKNNILITGYRDNKKYIEKVRYNPILFIKTQDESVYKSIHGENLKEKIFEDIGNARDFMKKYDGVTGFKYYGMEKWVTQYISYAFPNKINYDDNLISTMYFDIEVNTGNNKFPDIKKADSPVTLITFTLKKELFAFGLVDYKPKANEKYFKFKDEESLLKSFINIWSKDYPDIISGWNSEGFDIPYLVNRIRNVLGEEWVKKLSPFGIVKEKFIPTFKGSPPKFTYEIVGVSHLDYLLVYKKLAPQKLEQYKLDFVANYELGSGKIDYKEYKTLNELYLKDPQKFVSYGLRDTKLLLDMNKKLKYIELITLIAYYSKTNYEDVFKNTRIWDSLIYNYLFERNIIVDSFSNTETEELEYESDDEDDYGSNYSLDEKNKKIAGGYVKIPKVGRYRNGATIDALSLYPHLIMTWNISPDVFHSKVDIDISELLKGNNKYLEDCKKLNLTLCGNGSRFERSRQGFLAKMMQEMFELRNQFKEEKKKYDKLIQNENDIKLKKEYEEKSSFYNNYQNVIKILLNSAFGSLGNPGFRYYHSYYAEAITLSGQLTLMWVEKYINAFMNKKFDTKNVEYVLYADTDSIFINTDKMLENIELSKRTDFAIDFLDNTLQPFNNKVLEKLKEVTNSYSQKIFFKREKIFDNGIMIAKKKYLLNTLDNEGTRYTEPKISVTGLESIRSSTPEIVRNMLKESFKILINGTNDELIDFIDQCKQKFYAAPIEDISKPTSIKGLNKYIVDKKATKGTPIHVRAANVYNLMLDKMNLTDNYPYIEDDSKIKFVFLKKPNPTFENVIGFDFNFPPEFKLEKYIDYDTQFEKVFLSPLKIIINAIDWNITKIDTLEGIFL
jgi:DNA polymerase elongation subunit (family B)